MPIKIISQQEYDQKKLTGEDDGVMAKSVFELAHLDFLARVLYDGNSSLGGDQQSFLHAELKALVSVLAGTERLVIIHLGLQGTMMRYGFSFRAGTAGEDGLDYTEVGDPTHILEDSDFEPITPLEWKPFHDAYRAHVHLKRGNEAPVHITDLDAKAVVLHWDKEIDRMFQETTKDIKDDFRIKLSSVSVHHIGADGGPVGYRHGVSFHCERKLFLSGWTPMLNDDHDQVVIYHYKAADYGNLCPPRCRKYKRG